MGGKDVVKGRKKKIGRPSLADLRNRRQQPPRLPRSDTRLRRHRHHHVGYRNELEDEEEEEEDDEKKREKKLKLVLRLPQSYQNREENTCSKVVDQSCVSSAGFPQRVSRDVTVAHPAAPLAADASSASSFEEYDDGHKPLKKRKLGDADGNDDDDEDADAIDDDHDDDDGLRPDGSAVVDSGSVAQKEEKKDPAPGMDSDSVAATPVPDMKLLEFLLDKLQKKDTYGVFAEPVDLSELPDYLDVIENPMDFGTIRKKLIGAVYSTLEQIEKDVFLVCNNAMRYNAPETIYFKQARSIQELARKKFQKIRVDVEGIELEFKSAHRALSNSLTKNPLKRSSGRSTQEPVGSDFSSGATLATAGDTCTWSNTTQASAFEKPANMISFGDGSSFMAEIWSEKADELSAPSRRKTSSSEEGISTFEEIPSRSSSKKPSKPRCSEGKGLPSKLGRKPFILDENRRLTCKISNQLVGSGESLFSIFEGETKQLISVGLHAEHAYTRSLARFAAALGPVAWRVASRRIKQGLPAGLQFGPGWVGEYEPLPRSIALSVEQDSREAGYGTTRRSMPRSKRDTEETREESQGKQNDGLSKTAASGTLGPPMEGSSSGVSLEGKPGLLGEVAGSRPFLSSLFPQQNKPLAINAVNSDNSILGGLTSKFSCHIGSALPSQGQTQVEASRSPSAGSVAMEMSPGRPTYCSEVPTSSLLRMVSRNGSSHMPSGSGNHSVDKEDGAVVGRLADCKITSTPDGIRARNVASDYVSDQLPCGNREQVPINRARLMRMLPGKIMPNQTEASSMSTVDNSAGPSSKRDDSSATAAAVAPVAARSWMPMRSGELALTGSLGLHRMDTAAASVYSSARELSKEASVPSLGLQSENRFGSQVLPQPTHFAVGKESQSQNRSMSFPQLAVTDLSRLNGQSPWQGLGPQTHQRQKTDNFPPDLNIRFQLPGSPVRHTTGMMADSQQPDLALQL